MGFPIGQHRASGRSGYRGARAFLSHRRRPAPIGDMGPGLRGCQEIAHRLDWRRASFEASLREAPQDEEFS
jgi:hypothetical protein